MLFRSRTPDPLFDWVLPLVLDAAILAILGLGWPSGPDRPD